MSGRRLIASVAVADVAYRYAGPRTALRRACGMDPRPSRLARIVRALVGLLEQRAQLEQKGWAA